MFLKNLGLRIGAILDKYTPSGSSNVFSGMPDLPLDADLARLKHQAPGGEDSDMASKKKKKTATSPAVSPTFTLRQVKPITDAQREAFEQYASGQNLLLHGVAGTGKSFVAIYLALKDLNMFTTSYDKVIILRSVVPSRDMGFLPGDEREKAEAYETPYATICNQLYNRGDAYDILKNKGQIEFMTTSFLRGQTFNRSLVVIDEVQNFQEKEFDTAMTRIGDKCRVIVCGDYRQSDFFDDGENRQLLESLHVLKTMGSVSTVEFGLSDIVRSGFCKDWIEARWKYKMTHMRDPSTIFVDSTTKDKPAHDGSKPRAKRRSPL